MPTHPETSPEIISYRTLRKLVGMLGIFLPAFLFFGSFEAESKSFELLSSISAYYYSWMRDVFTGILFAIATFLFSYYGYDKRDNIATSLAGVCALGIALFPTADNCVTDQSSFLDEIHLVSAVAFFAILAYISLRLFTLSTQPSMTAEKQLRNKIYKACGVIILLMILLSLLYFLINNFQSEGNCTTDISKPSPIFWFETIALVAFATSWLVKGEMVLADKKT